MRRLSLFHRVLALALMPVVSTVQALSLADFTNGASVSASNTQFEANLDNNHASQVVQPKGLRLRKTADSAGLSTPPLAGEPIVYTIEVENIGLLSLNNVVLSDSIIPAAGISLVSGDGNADNIIDADETWVYQGVYLLTQFDLDSNGGGDGDIDNTVTLATDEIPSSTDSVQVPIVQAPAYHVDKTQTGGPNPATRAGDQLDYTITLVNDGNITLTNLNLTDTLPDASSGVLSGPVETLSADGVFEPQEHWTYTISYIVTQIEIDTLSSLTNTVSVVSNELTTPLEDTAVTTILARGSLGDKVWHDLNADGVQDTDEPGIEGILVQLIDAANNIVETQATDANGDYLFTDIVPGDYRLQFSLPNGYNYSAMDQSDEQHDSDADPLTGQTPLFTLTGDAAIAHQDAGMFLPATIGDRVWLDADGDGLQDADEDPIANVSVLLWHNGVIIAQTVTGSDGRYHFDGLNPGQYNVSVDPSSLPVGLVQTFDEEGLLDNDSGTITLISGENHDRAAFGYRYDTSINGNIGDTVWTDQNQNGVFDPGEIPIAGVPVGLYQGQTLIDSALTDELGQFLFSNLPAGDYRVVINPDDSTLGHPPVGYLTHPLGDPDVKDQITTIPNNETIVPLGAQQSFDDADFGYHLPDDEVITLGDLIFKDIDGDGIFNHSDTGIGNVSVSLFNQATGNLISTVYTQADGHYEFIGLMPDKDYRVVVQDVNGVLSGMRQTAMPNNALDGGQPGDSGNQNIVSIASSSNLNQDFGYAQISAGSGAGVIGDTVFFDVNANNAFDNGEGVSDVTVTLWNISGPIEYVVGSETTDENGKYIFTGLDNNAEYRVVVEAGSLPNSGVGWINTVDPDASLDGITEHTLSPTNPVYLGANFGYTGTDGGTITGTLWEDENEDGVLSADEDRRFEGVSVELRDEFGVLLSKTMSDAAGNYLFEQLPFGSYTVVVTDINNITGGYSHTDGTPDSDNNSQNDQGYQVVLTAQNPVDSSGDFGYRSDISTPITLASFIAIPGDYAGQVKFVWTTETEVGNIGFRLFANIEDSWLEVSDHLLPAAGDSLTLARYEYQADDLQGAKGFVLVDVDLYGDQVLHGPFTLGQQHGVEKGLPPARVSRKLNKAGAFIQNPPAQRLSPDKAMRLQREQREQEQHKRKLDKLLNRPLSSLGAWLLGAIIGNAEAGTVFTLADFELTQPGVYEVSHHDLQAAQIDIEGLAISRLSLSNQGVPVALEVLDDGDGVFNGSDALRFIGAGHKSLYTDANLYHLQTGGEHKPVVAYDAPIPGGSSAPYYLETTQYAPQNAYSLSAPTGDPWYADKLLSSGAPASKTIDLVTPNRMIGDAATLSIALWGGSDLPGDAVKKPDHHVRFDVNGVKVGDLRFDGVEAKNYSTQLNDMSSQASLTIKLSVPGDTGYLFDLVKLESVSLQYPRAFVARDNALSFESHWPKYRIGGFSSADIAVYVLTDNGDVQKIKKVQTGGNCTENLPACQAMFAGVIGKARYFAVAAGGFQTPAILTPVQPQNIKNHAQALVISHPDFMGLADNVLERYVADLAGEMNGAELIDVRSVYVQYSGGIVDPTAIHDYIKDQYARGTRQVLLVGGDTYDYKNYLGQNTQSLIPSLYTQTDPTIHYSPVDSMFGDVDADSVPDLVVARLPIQTPEQLRSLIRKRDAYMNRHYQRQAIFAADNFSELEHYSFSEDADNVIAAYFKGWDIRKAYIETLGAAAAKAAVSSAINEGTDLFVYTGHSSNDRLSFHDLFNGEDAAKLSNIGQPTVVTQWGCWNTYNVEPLEISMGDRFLLEGDQGAVAVLGTSTLTDANAERVLADLFYVELAKAKSLGQALLDAKTNFAKTHPDQIDLLLGVNIMGFPEVVVFPQ